MRWHNESQNETQGTETTSETLFCKVAMLDVVDKGVEGMIYNNDLDVETKPNREGWWIHEKYSQYKMYYIHIEAFNSKLCNSGGRWFLWRDMSKVVQNVTKK